MKVSNKKRHDIRIIQELEDLIPPLKQEEFEQLEANILEYGCREELIVWPEEQNRLLLVDGHNRLKICTKHKLDFKIKEMYFPSLDAAKDFMIINQLGRRNLSPQQASYLRGLRFSREKLQKGRYERHGSQQENDSGKTAARLASEYQVSQATIERDGTFHEGIEAIGKANPLLKKDILKGKIRLKKGMIRKASRLKQIPQVENVEELIGLLEGKPKEAVQAIKPGKEEMAVRREEAKHNLLELCIAMESTTFISKVMAKNILQAAEDLYKSFD